MKKLGELLMLLLENLKIQAIQFWFWLKTCFFYYRNLSFARTDLTLLLLSFWYNPFRISRKFWENRGRQDEIQPYGETPLTSLDTIMKNAGVTARDIVYDLGAGRGRLCFWLTQILGCKSVGVEIIPQFIEWALMTKTYRGVEGADFICGDMLKKDLSDATVVYCYGTTLSTPQIEKLIAHLNSLKEGSKVITVSYPLTDYQGGEQFELMNIFSVPFDWGDGNVYVHIKKR